MDKHGEVLAFSNHEGTVQYETESCSWRRQGEEEQTGVRASKRSVTIGRAESIGDADADYLPRYLQLYGWMM